MYKPRIAALLLAMTLFTGCTAGATAPADLKPAGEEVRILFATDNHYYAPALHNDSPLFYDMIESADGKLLQYSQELTAAFIDEVIASRPDALVLGGDLSFNGEKQSHEELAALLAGVTEAGIPVLVIPGNHDVMRTDAFAFTAEGAQYTEYITAEEFWALYAPLGAENATGKDPHSLSYVYPLSAGVQLLMLDTARYEYDTPKENGRIRKESLDWLEAQLKAAQNAGIQTITVTHHNLLIHNPMFESYTISNDSTISPLFEKYGVVLNLSGHMHAQHIAHSGAENGIYDVAQGSLAVWPNYYGEVTASPSGALTYTAHPLDVAAWASRQGSTDPFLLNFEDASRAFFDGAMLTGLGRILQNDAIPETATAPMHEVAAHLNSSYFAGMPTGLEPDDTAFALWLEYAPTDLFTFYLRSIMNGQTESRSLLIAPEN